MGWAWLVGLSGYSRDESTSVPGRLVGSQQGAELERGEERAELPPDDVIIIINDVIPYYML